MATRRSKGRSLICEGNVYDRRKGVGFASIDAYFVFNAHGVHNRKHRNPQVKKKKETRREKTIGENSSQNKREKGRGRTGAVYSSLLIWDGREESSSSSSPLNSDPSDRTRFVPNASNL